MELALIPPNQFLETTLQTRMQLILPHELMHNKPYQEHYINVMEDDAFYTILDNGAAEASRVSGEDLMELAINFGVSEIACPDVLGNSFDTMLDTNIFLDKYLDDLMNAGIKIGAVAQGTTVEEVIWSIQQYRINWLGAIDVIYIPRLLVNMTFNPLARFQVLDQLLMEDLDAFDFHFFGASIAVDELRQAALDDRVRSFDTSMPFNFAYEGMLLVDYQDDLLDVRRTKDYFTATWDEAQAATAKANVTACLEWANGEQ